MDGLIGEAGGSAEVARLKARVLRVEAAAGVQWHDAPYQIIEDSPTPWHQGSWWGGYEALHLVLNNYDGTQPVGLALATGLGLHQFWPEREEGYSGRRLGPVHIQPRLHGAARLYAYPWRRHGPFVELVGQVPLDKRHSFWEPGHSWHVTLGWRFGDL